MKNKDNQKDPKNADVQDVTINDLAMMMNNSFVHLENKIDKIDNRLDEVERKLSSEILELKKEVKEIKENQESMEYRVYTNHENRMKIVEDDVRLVKTKVGVK
jgi:predicted  nucleic acid-binding Zn-ribbon protein